MNEEKRKQEAEGSQRETMQAFDLYDRIHGVVGEYCDNWILIGESAGGQGKLLISTSGAATGNLKSLYEQAKEWNSSNE